MAKETTFEHPPRGHVAILGYEPASDDWYALYTDDDGNLQVDFPASAELNVVPQPFTGYSVHQGTSGNTLSAEVQFDETASKVTVYARVKDLLIVLVDAEGADGDQIFVPVSSAISVDFEARGFKHQNSTAGETATYYIEGWWR